MYGPRRIKFGLTTSPPSLMVGTATADELSEMGLDTVEELEDHLRHQIDSCIDEEGEAGVDWMVSYDIEVAQVGA